MRLLNRNKTNIKYANYLGRKQVRDDKGYFTGMYDNEYTTPKTIKCYVSASKGISSEEMFGVNIQYDKTLTYEKPDIDINESSRVWIEEDEYIVKKIAKSLNYCVIAISKITNENN